CGHARPVNAFADTCAGTALPSLPSQGGKGGGMATGKVWVSVEGRRWRRPACAALLLLLVTSSASRAAVATSGSLVGGAGGPRVAAAPTFAPAPGSFSTAVALKLACATAGAQIVYTTDGTSPSRHNGINYAGPVAIAHTVTVRAIAFGKGIRA